jgi:multiple sugar transport system permease protein
LIESGIGAARGQARPTRVPLSAVRPRVSYRFQLSLMLLPYLLGIALLVVIPATVGLPIALTEYNALQPPEFVGLANFAAMANDPIFWKSVFNSSVYIALAVPLRLLGALALALLLWRPLPFGGGFRAAVYLPTVVPDVAWALLWLWLLNPAFGPVNQLLALFGIPGPAWMVHEWGARYAVVLMMIWQIGEGLVICLAGLGDIPSELLEQAASDGADRWQIFRGVVLPLLAPVLLILLFRDTIYSLQVSFVPAQILGNGGGPNYATTFMPMYIYNNAFEYLRFGYAAALTWAMYAFTALVLLAQYGLARQWRLGFRDAE